MVAPWRQVIRLPHSLAAIARIVADDCSIAAADAHLWAFRAFHLEPAHPMYRARPWGKTPLRDVAPTQVEALTVDEMAFMMRVAMEIEDPILEYSHQNGEGFRRLLPALGRFMGKNEVEAAYAAAHGLPWCESPWCAEERRHGNLFAKLIERLTGAAPTRENPNQPRVVTADEAEALRHLTSRESAEWSSSSTYVVMAAHASGNLHALLRDVARDEIKHLCVLSAADRYLLGPRPWARLAGLIRIGLEHYRGQRRYRSGGARIGANAITAFEVVCAHLLVEFRVRRWLARVPLRTLASIFETGSDVPTTRASLARWKKSARDAAVDQRRFEERHAAMLARIVEEDFAGMALAAVPESAEDRATRRQIARRRPAALRRSLRDALRDRQIRGCRASGSATSHRI